MKTNKKSTYLLILAIISFCIATVIGFRCFDIAPEHIVLRIILTIQNSISAFAFSPSVKVLDVLNGMSEQSTVAEWGFLYAYAIALFLAQLCTATAVFIAFKTVITKAAENIQSMTGNKEYVTIVGYNEKVEILLDNIAKRNEEIRTENWENRIEWMKAIFRTKQRKEMTWEKEKVVFLVTEHSFNESEQLELAKNHVIWIDADILSLSEKEKKKLVKKISNLGESNPHPIILFEESEMRNFSIYSLLCTDEILKDMNVKCYLYCEDDGIREVIEEYYSKSKKADNNKVVDLFIFSLAEIKVNKIFEQMNQTLWKKPEMTEEEYIENSSWFDIHLLIVGFGNTGQQMLMQTLNQGVLHSRSRIWIDIIDRNALKKDDIFMKRFHENYIHEVKDDRKEIMENCATYTIGREKCDGELKIRFMKADVRGKNFKKILDKIVKTEDDKSLFPLTNVMIGFHELDTLASCIMDVKKHAQEIKAESPIEMFVCADISDDLLKYLNYNDVIGSQNKKPIVKIVDTVSNKDEICLESIFNTEREELAKSYYKTYNIIYMKVNHGAKYELDWSKASYEEKMSNYALSAHQKIKSKIISAVWKNHAFEKREQYIGKDGVLLKHDNDLYMTDDFLKNLEHCPFLEEMIRLEHRRWNYFMASRGWQYEETKKGLTEAEKKEEKQRQKEEKKHSCLCSYEILKEKEKEKIVYDLIPLLFEYEEDLKNR